ncbi:MAG: ABC transporter permease [Victivallaceae bacterium]|nr:ABC transporter permease [Victivallaceae bacterium]
MRVEFFLARRYLRPKRNEVSIITLISIIGVTLGVAVLIVVLAVMTGFADEMRAKLLQTQPHLNLMPKSGYVAENTLPAQRAIAELGGRSSRMIYAPVMVLHSQELSPQLAMGVEFDKIRGEMDLDKTMVGHLRPEEPKFELEPGEIVIGDETAAGLRLKLGDRVLIQSMKQLANLVTISDGKMSLKEQSEVTLPAEFRVAGIFHFGKYDVDSRVIIMDLNDAAELFLIPWNSANNVACWLDDPDSADTVADALREKLPEYDVITWKSKNQLMLHALTLEKNMMFFLLFFIVLVAAFSISNNLITTVYQKTREIGMLKAIGASNFQMVKVFLLQGLMVGVIGTGIGTSLGVLVVRFRMQIMKAMASSFGFEIFPKELYFFDALPAKITPGDLASVVVAAILLCTLGGLLPALRAAHLDPARAFRDE